MLFVDVKFASMLGPRLRNFKQKKDYLWNYSCPVCGDSSTNKLRARGFIYKAKSDLFVKCHNCGYGTNIGNFIKFLNVRICTWQINHTIYTIANATISFINCRVLIWFT